MDFNRDIGIILFILGKGKWTKVMCNCPSHSAWFVQQSPHMGTVKRMGKYLIQFKFWSYSQRKFYRNYICLWNGYILSEIRCAFTYFCSGKKTMHLFIWILLYGYNVSLLPYYIHVTEPEIFFPDKKVLYLLEVNAFLHFALFTYCSRKPPWLARFCFSATPI